MSRLTASRTSATAMARSTILGVELRIIQMMSCHNCWSASVGFFLQEMSSGNWWQSYMPSNMEIAAVMEARSRRSSINLQTCSLVWVIQIFPILFWCRKRFVSQATKKLALMIQKSLIFWGSWSRTGDQWWWRSRSYTYNCDSFFKTWINS